MHNRDKHPEIWALKEKSEEALIPLMTARKVHTDAMRDVRGKIDTLRQEMNTLNDEAMKDADKIAELRDTISRTARAMGAVVASGG